jgi:hypothetical protein
MLILSREIQWRLTTRTVEVKFAGLSTRPVV